MKKILLIQLRKLGDVITTTPAVRQLRNNYPDVQIDFLTENLGANVYKYNKNIDNLISVKRKQSFLEYSKLIFKIRKEKYDLVLDLFSNPKSAQITLLSGSKMRYGYKKGIRDFVYTKKIPLDNNKYPYVSHHKLSMMQDFIDIDYDDISLEVDISNKERDYAVSFCKENNISKDKTIALCVVSERESARIPNDLYIDIANSLIDKGYNIYLTYGPNEKEQTYNVYNGINEKTRVVYDYQIPTVLENRAILEHCKMYLGNDGGTKHLSIATKIPTFAIFDKENHIENWTPQNSNIHKAIKYEDYYKKNKDIIEKIDEFIIKIKE